MYVTKRYLIDLVTKGIYPIIAVDWIDNKCNNVACDGDCSGKVSLDGKYCDRNWFTMHTPNRTYFTNEQYMVNNYTLIFKILDDDKYKKSNIFEVTFSDDFDTEVINFYFKVTEHKDKFLIGHKVTNLEVLKELGKNA